MGVFKKVVAVIILYLQLMSINFTFLPFSIRSIFSLLTIPLILKDGQIRQLLKTRTISLSFNFLFVWGLISFISILANGTKDLYFISVIISQLNVLLSSIFIIYILYFKFKFSSFDLINLIIFVIFLFNLSAIILYKFPSIKDLLFSMTVRETPYEAEFIANATFRFVGFGPHFFGAGVINGLGLILISFILKNKKVNLVATIYYLILFIVILFAGSIASRTTIIGFLISILNYILKVNIFRWKNIPFIIGLGLFIFFIMNFINTNVDSNELTGLTKFGFEYYYNFKETGQFTTSSTENLKEMIKMPSSFLTYILGDGYFTDPNTSFFYKGIDIGYLRLIYYSGIIGLLFMILFYSNLINSSVMKYFFGPDFCYLILLYLAIVYFKGVTDINQFIILIIGFLYCEKSNIIFYKQRKL